MSKDAVVITPNSRRRAVGGGTHDAIHGVGRSQMGGKRALGERQGRADTSPTVVATGTPAIDVKLLLRIATANVASGRASGPYLVTPIGAVSARSTRSSKPSAQFRECDDFRRESKA